MREYKLTNQSHNRIRPSLLISAVTLSLTANTAFSASSCMDAPYSDIQDFLPKLSITEEAFSAPLTQRFESLGIAEKLNEAGLFGQARTLLKQLYNGDEGAFSPQAALTYARSYRLQGTDLNSAQFGTSPSEISAGRVACLEQADLYLERYLVHLESLIKAESKTEGQKATITTKEKVSVESGGEAEEENTQPLTVELEITPENATVLYGLFSLERAETQLQFGDFLYSLEPQQFMSNATGASIDRQSAMTKYRASRVYLAMAEGARPAIAEQDHARTRRAILAEKLSNRLDWINGGLFFNGLAYLEDTPFIGLERDESGLALSGQIQDALERFEKNQNKLIAQMSIARAAIWNGAKELRELDREKAQYKTNLKTELFQELATLESRTGSHDIRINEVMGQKDLNVLKIQTKHTENVDELISLMNATKEEAKKDYNKVLSDIRAVSALVSKASVDDTLKESEDKFVLEEIWSEIESRANKTDEGESRQITLPPLDTLKESLKLKLAQFSSEGGVSKVDEQELDNIIDGFYAADTEWQALADQRSDLDAKLENLESQLLSQGEERFYVLATAEAVSVQDDIKFIKDLAGERTQLLINIAESQSKGAIDDLRKVIDDGVIEVQKRAQKFVENEIKEVNKLIKNAEAVFDAIQDGARNFQAASQAAQAVFGAMQAIPSGTGLVVIQDK